MHARVIAVAILVIVMTATSHASVIVNGGFEAPDIPTGTFDIFPVIPGWSTISGAGIEIQDNVAGSPFEGDQHVELDSTENSGMRQTINTAAGQSYQLSFAFSARPGILETSNGIDILWDGAPLANVTADGTGLADTSWAIHSYNVVASGALTDLDFVATGTSDSLGGYLDTVKLQIPEPATGLIWAMLAMIVSPFIRRRARK